MGKWTRKTWLIKCVGIALIVVSVWIGAAFWTQSSLGASIPILADLRSRILADYGSDFLGGAFKSLKLSILGDFSSEQNITSGGSSDLGDSFSGLVPTATDNAESTEVPPTKAPTNTPTLMPSPIPSATSTQIEITEIPTSTQTSFPTATYTPKPTKKPDPTAIPSATSTQIEITESPTSTHTTVPTAIYTPKPTKKPDPTPSDQQLIPKLECVKYVGGGSFIAYFGYKNPNSKIIALSIGPKNHFEPGAEDRGQPTSFESGRTPGYPDAAFEVLFDGENLTWDLDGNSVTASSSSVFCDPPSTPTATPTPTPEPDGASPELSGGIISPTSGALPDCSITVSITNLYVDDPAPSSGIDWVKLKYKVEGFTSYIFSNPLLSCGGGFNPDGGWSGCFYGSVDIAIDPEWDSPNNDPFNVTVWSKIKDNAGNTSYFQHANYTLPASCGT